MPSLRCAASAALFAAAAAQLPEEDDVMRLWPQPRHLVAPPGAAHLVLDPAAFTMTAAAGGESDVLAWNMDFYTKDIFARAGTPNERPGASKPLARLEISVGSAAAGHPSLAMNESYRLELASPVAKLTAPEVWGAVRGLETFSQMLQMNRAYVIRHGDGVVVEDAPRFPWRGLLIDPARHFIPVREVKATIDQMAQNKLNALHWHLTDSEAFAICTDTFTAFPLLSQRGAYAPALCYSEADLAAVVAYGRLRGVRVVPEVDLPAHMASWAQGYPDLITDCPAYNPQPTRPRYFSPADVTNERLYAAIDEILAHLEALLPDASWHVGGDEPHFDCWNANANVTAYMKARGLDAQGLYAAFLTRYQSLVKKHAKHLVGWVEITENGAPEKGTTVVGVWNGNEKLAKVIATGYRAIVSSNWYLDTSVAGEWEKFYTDDPMSYLAANATQADRARVLGGEACMWGNHFTTENTQPQTWPNAAATAEQLWSANIVSVPVARTRIAQHRCRMVRRGVQAGPVSMDYCDADLYVRMPNAFFHPGDFPADKETPNWNGHDP